jgi:hypothetical protein
MPQSPSLTGIPNPKPTAYFGKRPIM